MNTLTASSCNAGEPSELRAPQPLTTASAPAAGSVHVSGIGLIAGTFANAAVT
jgi:hypothetical protein